MAPPEGCGLDFGRTDYKAKGWAERQSKQSTHCEKGMLSIPVSRTLLALGRGATKLIVATEPSARLSEEPCAGKPHAGICEGGAR